MKKNTGCDAIMIGRGALGNPWIFENIINSMNGKTIKKTLVNDIDTVCLEHIKLLEKYKPNIVCVNLSKKHINYYLKNFNNSSLYRTEIMRCDNISDIKNTMKC